MEKDSKQSTEDMIDYIQHNIDDLLIKERQDILQMIINSVEDKKIQTKGNGTQIKIDDIPIATIKMIYTYIQTKLNSKKNELERFNL